MISHSIDLSCFLIVGYLSIGYMHLGIYDKIMASEDEEPTNMLFLGRYGGLDNLLSLTS